MRVLTIFFILALVTPSLWAKKSNTGKKLKTEVNFIDKTHLSIASLWDDANNGLDTFFANQKFTEAESKGYVRITLRHIIQEIGEKATLIDFKLKTSFPRTTKKLKFVIKDDTTDVQTDTRAGFSSASDPTNKTAANTTSKYSAILQYEFLKKKRWKVTTDQGVRLDLPLNPFVKMRARFKADSHIGKYKFTLYFIQNFKYYYQERFSESSELQFYRKINSNMGLYFSNGISWNDDGNTLTLYHGLSLHHTLGRKTVSNYSVGAVGNLKTIEYNTLRFEFNITHQLYKKWLYGTLSLGTTLDVLNTFASNNFLYISTSAIF